MHLLDLCSPPLQESYSAHTKAMKPMPATVRQGEAQKMLFEEQTMLLISPYIVNKQRLRVNTETLLLAVSFSPALPNPCRRPFLLPCALMNILSLFVWPNGLPTASAAFPSSWPPVSR